MLPAEPSRDDSKPAQETPARVDGLLGALPNRQVSSSPTSGRTTRRTDPRSVASSMASSMALSVSRSGPANRAAPAAHLSGMTPGRLSGSPVGVIVQPLHFDEMRYPGSREAMRWPAVAECVQWARNTGFEIRPTADTSCTIRNAVPRYDAGSGTVKYTPEPGRGVGRILLNTTSMANPTLAALTIIHEVTHAMRGAREHGADWPSYQHERLADEGQSVYATLRFTQQVFATGADRNRFIRDAAVAMPTACIRDWLAAYQQHDGRASEALYRELGEIYDRHVPQSARWARAFDSMAARLKLPREGTGGVRFE